jgi:hypothetical protein
MGASKQNVKKSKYKNFTLCSAGIIILSELGTWLLMLPEIYNVLITIIFFPVFVLSLFLWLNASGKERDIPFIGY